jgi:O-antigen/teichoic acid export membrane protein
MAAWMLGPSAAGVLTALNAATSLGSLLTVPVAETARPRLARRDASGDRAAYLHVLWWTLGLVAVVGGGVTLVSALFARPFLRVVFSPELAAHATTFVLLAGAAGVQQLAGALEVALTSMNRGWTLGGVTVAGALTTCAACACLIRPDGIEGAAIASLVGAIFVAGSFGAATVTCCLWDGKRAKQGTR